MNAPCENVKNLGTALKESAFFMLVALDKHYKGYLKRLSPWNGFQNLLHTTQDFIAVYAFMPRVQRAVCVLKVSAFTPQGNSISD